MYLNYCPMTNANHFSAVVFVFVISYIFDLIFLYLSLQHTNTILHNANTIRASPCALTNIFKEKTIGMVGEKND